MDISTKFNIGDHIYSDVYYEGIIQSISIKIRLNRIGETLIDIIYSVKNINEKFLDFDIKEHKQIKLIKGVDHDNKN